MEILALFAVLAAILDGVNKKNKRKRQRAALEAQDGIETKQASKVRSSEPPQEPAWRRAPSTPSRRPAPSGFAGGDGGVRPRPGAERSGEMDPTEAIFQSLGLGDLLAHTAHETAAGGSRSTREGPDSGGDRKREGAAPQAGGRTPPAWRELPGEPARESARSTPPQGRRLPEYRAPQAPRRKRDRSTETEPAVARTRASERLPSRRPRSVHDAVIGFGTDPSSRPPSNWGVKVVGRAAGDDVRSMLAGSGSRELRNAIILKEVFGPPKALGEDRPPLTRTG